MSEPIRTGGCQCGAVRFRIRGKLGRPSICHCRMCQKQFGGFFSALVTAPDEGMEWTRGEPTYFQSSVNIERGFCRNCGTPMTYRHPGGLELAIGAFDDRGDLAPQIQVNYDAAPALGRDDLRPAGARRPGLLRAAGGRSSPSSIPTTIRTIWPAEGVKI